MAASNRPVRRRSTEIAPRRPQPLARPRKTRPHQPPDVAVRNRGKAPATGLVALPWPVRALLLAALLGLGALAILLGGGTLGRVTAGLGGAISSAFGGIIPVGGPSASASQPGIPDTAARPTRLGLHAARQRRHLGPPAGRRGRHDR